MPPPHAAEARTAGPDQIGLDNRTSDHRTRRLIVTERHSRAACEHRSHQAWPCHSCCRCRPGACTHPAFGGLRVLEEAIR